MIKLTLSNLIPDNSLFRKYSKKEIDIFIKKGMILKCWWVKIKCEKAGNYESKWD